MAKNTRAFNMLEKAQQHLNKFGEITDALFDEYEFTDEDGDDISYVIDNISEDISILENSMGSLYNSIQTDHIKIIKSI